MLPKTAAGRVALIHTCFNIGTTLILLPLGTYLARLAVRILPELPASDTDTGEGMRLNYLKPITANGKEGGLGVSAIVIDQLRHELHRSMSMARDNVAESSGPFWTGTPASLEDIEKREEYIDFLEPGDLPLCVQAHLHRDQRAGLRRGQQLLRHLGQHRAHRRPRRQPGRVTPVCW